MDVLQVTTFILVLLLVILESFKILGSWMQANRSNEARKELVGLLESLSEGDAEATITKTELGSKKSE